MTDHPYAADPEKSFPPAINVDHHVETTRKERLADLTRITVIGLIVRSIVIFSEAIGVWISGSQTLLVDLVASIFDSFASIALLAVIHFAAKPPDDDHPFGHGRAEPLAGFQLALLLTFTGLWLAFSNGIAMSQPASSREIAGWLWIIPALATTMLCVVTYWISIVGKRTASTALQAESAHFAGDAATSFLTTFTLIFAGLFPAIGVTLDHIGGIILAVVMIVLGLRAAWGNLHPLLDHIPESGDFEKVKKSALQVPGVIDVEKLRIQLAGPDAHINIDIEVDPEITVDAAHLIAQQVRAQIQNDWHFVRDVIVHIEPYYEGDH